MTLSKNPGVQDNLNSNLKPKLFVIDSIYITK